MSETMKANFETFTVHYLKFYAQLILSQAVKIASKRSSGTESALKIPVRKKELINWIVNYLTDTHFIQHCYQELDEIGAAAVGEAVHSGECRVDLIQFEAKYGQRLKIPRLFDWREGFSDIPLHALFISDSGLMSQEVVEKLRPMVPQPQVLAAVYTETLSLVHDEPELLVPHLTEKAALNDVKAILLAIDSGKVGVSAKTNKPTKIGARVLREALSQGDFYPEGFESDFGDSVKIGPSGIRPYAWALLTQVAKLAQIKGNKLALGRNGKAALKQPPHVVLKQIWERWLANKSFHELHRIEVIKGQGSKSRPLAAPQPARRQIAATLGHLEAGQWIKLDHFIKYLLGLGLEFEIVRDLFDVYIGSPDYGNLGEQGGWDHLEGRFCRAFLLEYAATLGLIDVALAPPWDANCDLDDLSVWDLSCLSRYDGLLALRLNSLGAYILGKTDVYDPIHEGPNLLVLANREVTFIGHEAATADRMFLDKICTKSSDHVWRITLPKLLEAAEKGTSVNDALEFLETRSRKEIPQPVRAFFEDARERTNQVRDEGEARLISCADPTVALLIANDTKLKNLCLLAGDRRLVVPSKKFQAFRRELKKLGYAVLGN